MTNVSDADVAAGLRRFIVDEVGGEDDFTDDDQLLAEGLIDSLSLLELVRFIEDTYEREVSDLDVTLENFGSIDSMVRFVRETVLA